MNAPVRVALVAVMAVVAGVVRSFGLGWVPASAVGVAAPLALLVGFDRRRARTSFVELGVEDLEPGTVANIVDRLGRQGIDVAALQYPADTDVGTVVVSVIRCRARDLDAVTAALSDAQAR